MTEITVGHEYKAKVLKSGKYEKNDGQWEWMLVQAPGPRQTAIGVFVDNAPSGINYTGVFKVDSINSVEVKNSQGKDGQWHRQGSVTVHINASPGDETQFETSDAAPRRRSPNTEIKRLGDFFND